MFSIIVIPRHSIIVQESEKPRDTCPFVLGTSLRLATNSAPPQPIRGSGLHHSCVSENVAASGHTCQPSRQSAAIGARISGARRTDQARPRRAFCLRCALRNSCGEPTKELNRNHGVLISDLQFDTFLKCRTKAHFTFSSARTGEPSHPIRKWQGHIAENYQKNCRD